MSISGKNFSLIHEALSEVTLATLEWIRANVLTDDYGPMSPMLEHAITSVVPASDRAILVRYGCQLMGCDWREALPGMAAFEFQNINLLVTDDYFDERDTSRMGVVPINKRWGSKAAIALGFVLKSLSNESLIIGWNRRRNWNLNEAIETIEWASRWQYYSQFLEDDLLSVPLADVTLEDYTNLIEKATASGIAGALELGAIIGGCSVELRKAIKSFGLTLGCLLQVRDDCIDYIYNEELIKKGAFSDFFSKRRRLPLLVAYWEGDLEQKRAIEYLLGKRYLTLEHAAVAVDLILRPNVQAFIRRYANETADKAMNQLDCLQVKGGTRENLRSLIDLFRDL